MGLADRGSYTQRSSNSNGCVIEVQPEAGKWGYIEPSARKGLLRCQKTGMVNLVGRVYHDLEV